MYKNFLETVKIVKGLDPVANLQTGSPVVSNEVNMGLYQQALFLLYQKSGGTNTGTLVATMEACTDAAGTSPTAIPFNYRKVPTGTSDTLGALIAATSAGFTTTANETAVYAVEISADEVQQAIANKPYLRMKLTAGVTDAVLGSILTLLGDGRFQGATLPSAIA